jgi:hypothetical protein
MKNKLKDTSFQILLKIITALVIGFLFVGRQIVSLNESLFSYTIFAVSLILFYHSIKTFGIKEFLLPAAIYSVIVIMTIMHISLIASFFKNLIMFALLGAMCFYSIRIEKQKFSFNKTPVILFYWLAGGIVFYLVSGFLNFYIFGLDTGGYRDSFMLFSWQQLKIGLSFGLGAGLGMLTSLLKNDDTKNDKETWKSKTAQKKTSTKSSRK